MAIPELKFDPSTNTFMVENKPVGVLSENGEVTVTDPEFNITREDVTHLAASALQAGNGAVFRKLEGAGYSPFE